jgi:hypothetical protein
MKYILIKYQLVIDRKSNLIISTGLFNGTAHDGTIFRRTTPVHPAIIIFCDSGYRGLQKYHSNTLMPIRKEISSIRMKVEHIIGHVKNF